MKIYLSLYLFFAIILTQFYSAYFFSKAKTNYKKTFTVLSFCIGIYLFGYLMIINSNNLQEMIFWNQFQYFGLPFISVLWLMIALVYTKAIYTLKKRWIIVLLFFVPIITFFIRLTNSRHHLFYKSWEMKQVLGHFALYMERGCWYYVNISYTLLCMLFAVFVYHFEYLKNRANYTRSQLAIFNFASLLPFVGTMLILSARKEQGIDYVALIMPVSLLIVSYGILKHDFLEVKALARETIFESNPNSMIIFEPGLKIIDYNKAAQEFFKALNISLDNCPIEHILEQRPELLEAFKDESTRDFHLVIDGKKHFFEINSALLGDPLNRDTKILKDFRDVTERKNIQEKLEVLATIDSLSGLYNRASFMRLAQKKFTLAKENDENLSLLMMDIDYFKNINDTFGHAGGDEVIRKIGDIIKNGFRKTDITGRLGGDEFAVILGNAPLEDAKKAAEEFRKIVANTKIIYEEQEIGLTISIGVATTPASTDNNDDIENILKRADNALYEAKARGRNCIVVSE
ncbi:MAG TPA: diguanylate cyclase [Clostridia bacterium]|nr:diguanylate cyclase [Clostridia bacterium]